MAGLAGLSPTRIVRPLITAYLPARPGPGGIGLGRIPSHSGGGKPDGSRQLCAMLAEGLKKKILLLSSWQCRRVPAEQGTGDSAFCRTPSGLPVMCWVAYGCASMPALFGLSLMGSALPVGCVGFSAGARCLFKGYAFWTKDR